MNRTILLFLLPAIVAMLPACNRPQERIATSNSTYDVDLLFTHEGARVYRFFDNGTWVYYAVPDGALNPAPIKVWVPPKPEKDDSTDTEARATP